MIRVTGLGEYFHILDDWLLTLGSVLKIASVILFWATFFCGTSFIIILANNWFCHILGNFFTNSSGHPGFGSYDQRRGKCSVASANCIINNKKMFASVYLFLYSLPVFDDLLSCLIFHVEK
jgi:hypothetical protein